MQSTAAHLNNYKKNLSSEFYAVGYSKQLNKIESGKLFLQNHLNIDIVTFIPPYNTYDSNTVKVIINLGFKNLSAASYGKIQVIPGNINYIPYTALLSDMDDIKSTIYRVSMRNEGKDYLIVIMMHTDDFINSKYHSRSKDYISSNKVKRISLAELDHDLSEIKKFNNIHFITFNELPHFIKDLGSNRLKSNMEYEDIIPVFWLSNFRNIYYLDRNEINLNKYLRLFYQVLFYPIIFLVFILITNLLLKVTKKTNAKYLKNIAFILLILSVIIIMTILSIDIIKPKYLVLITLLLSISYALLVRAKKNNA